MKITNRLNFLNERIVLNEQNAILEIGALNHPLLPSNNVKYLDWFSTEELTEMYPHRAKNIQPIDYVVKTLNFSEHVKDKFDLAIACHVIEHIPNMILWLQNMQEIIKPNGYVFLVIPHKKYTFDHLRPLTKLAELLDRFERNVQQPEIKDVFEQKYYYRPIKQSDGWNPKILKERIKKNSYPNAVAAWNDAKIRINKNGYVDVHCNVLTQNSFVKIINELRTAKLTKLKPVYKQDVIRGFKEFYIILQKG